MQAGSPRRCPRSRGAEATRAGGAAQHRCVARTPRRAHTVATLALDVNVPDWPLARPRDRGLNMIHIAPWRAAEDSLRR